MKKFSVLLACAALFFAATSCVDLGPVEDRLDALESQVSSIQTLVDAMNKKVYVSSVTPITDGYVIEFTDGTKVTVMNGSDGLDGTNGTNGKDGVDGKDGKDGQDGKDGKDGDAYFSSFEIKDGFVYITLNDANKTQIVLSLASESPMTDIKSITPINGVECEYGDYYAAFKVSPSSVAEKITASNVKINIYEFNSKYEIVSTKTLPFDEVSASNGMLYIKGFIEDPSQYESGFTAATITVFDAVAEYESAMCDAYFYGDPYVEYGGVKYRVKRMQDGRVWFTENLRYVPSGMTPSNDTKNVTAGIYYPVVLNAAGTAAAFSTDSATIVKNGYLYQSEVALGLKVGDITTVDQAQALEYTQGICPDGYHIPTADEIINLVGKAVSPLPTWEDAPYYDKAKKNGSMALLNEDGFNADAWGAFTVIDNTKTSGTIMGYLKSFPSAIASGYVCGSTYAGVTYNTANDATSGIKNVQFYGFMPMASNGTFNGAKLSYRIAASVRCVMN